METRVTDPNHRDYNPFVPGDYVRTVRDLEKRDYDSDAVRNRRPDTEGTVLARHDSHGLCYDVKHFDGIVGTYDPDELLILLKR